VNRRWVPWIVGAVGGVVLTATLVLMTLNSTLSKDPFTAVFLVVIASYLAVSAVLCTRLPSNPIGWLLLTVGGGILFSGFCAEYATYALGTSPGSLPFGLAAAWFQNWGFISVAAIPIVLLLFPTGHIPSPRWRWVLYGLIVAPILLGLAGFFSPGPIDVSGDIQPQNPLGIEALRGPIHVINWVAGIAFAVLAVAAVVSIVIRYRRAAGDERQQLRWLAMVASLCALTLLLVLATSINLGPNDSSSLNDFAFALFLISIGIGIPVAIAVALLRYRLYDLDVVVKKAVVATVLVLLLTVATLVLFLVPVLVIGVPVDSPGVALVAGIAIGGLAWPSLRLSRRIADRIVYGGRATPYEVLTEFSDRMAESYATDDVLPRMGSILAAGTGARSVTIWLLVGNQLRPATTWPADAGDDPDTSEADLAPTTALADMTGDVFVVRHQGEQLGAITVSMHANDPMNPTKEKLIKDLAGQAGLVLRNVRLIEELRASRRRLVAAQDAERRRLERNIHDGSQQQLVALQVKQRLAEGMIERDPAKARELMAQIQADTTEALDDLRDLARGIYPPLLADKGLPTALESQARKSPVPMTVESASVGRYSQEVEAAVYFCALEAMNNLAKYARASAATVSLAQVDGTLTFAVTDDGIGFRLSDAGGGTGLQGMADRLDAIGGSLEVRSEPGQGTSVLGRVPVED